LPDKVFASKAKEPFGLLIEIDDMAGLIHNEDSVSTEFDCLSRPLSDVRQWSPLPKVR
jgi:hypothetical protein